LLLLVQILQPKVIMEQKPSGKGSHLHFQVRKCIKVEKRNKKKTYLRNSEGFLYDDGFYEVVDYDNGYNGCIDPGLFYSDLFNVDLSYKDNGLDVERLQIFLKEYGTFTYPNVTGYYGEETRKAVYAFQIKEKVSNPLLLRLYKGRYCHEATRKRLNELLNNI
jgi:Putative peptidoglycan binding domain